MEPARVTIGSLRLHHRLELASTILLSLATFGSAWSAWRSSAWNGVQAIENGRATTYIAESVRASTRAQMRQTIDVTLWLAWLEATARGDEATAGDLTQRFREEFQPVFEDWLEEPRPPGAVLAIPSGSPFAFADYQKARKEAFELQRLAEESSQRATTATAIANDYVLTAVLYASVLLLAGVSLKVEAFPVRKILIYVAGLLLCGTLIATAFLPKVTGRELPPAVETTR